MVNCLYSKFLICYDIENDKTRTKFFDKMKDYGLIPIQKSVFYGDLNNAEIKAIKNLSFEILDSLTDKCIFVKCNLLTPEIIRQGVGYENFDYIAPDGYDTI